MPIVNKILIADDDSEMRESLASLLEDSGYKVIRAEDGEEAVEMAAKELSLIHI